MPCHISDQAPDTHGPAGPLVFDTRTLGRRPARPDADADRPGARRIWASRWSRVPAGADVELDVRLEAVIEGVLVTGTATAPLAGECARCLEPFDLVGDGRVPGAVRLRRRHGVTGRGRR